MESYLIWLLIIIMHCLSMQFDQVLSSSSSISNPNQFCPNEQRLILLQFKHMFEIEKSVASFCGKYEQSNPKTLSWNESSTNCCSWDGVKCNNLTGHVTIIDLSCSQLFGTFHPNITLFKLPSLKILNLAFNNFQKSSIPSSIGMLAPTLTHLILSSSSLAGLIPSEITLLSKLVVLDLSKNEGLLFHNYQPNSSNFDYIIRNLTQLKILNLDSLNMSCIIPNSLMNLTTLKSLHLRENGLLQTLNLSCNRLQGRIPRGSSFDIFSNSSYLENTALCGPPLSKKCQGCECPTPQHDYEDDSYAWIGFTWQVILMGYAFGMLIGLAVGCVSIYMGKPKWVVTMIDEKGLKLLKKYK